MFFNELKRCYLIAEIGVNHGGDVALAKEMILSAKKAGADAVKFQTFTAENLVTQATPKVKYQESTTSEGESHYEMIKSLEFQRDDHYPVFDYCKALEIDFISTPYDVASARFLEKLGVEIYKVASADIVDPLLNKFLAETGKPVIISTGMATLGEVEAAVNIYRNAHHENVCLLHCVSNYPCSTKSLNLAVIKTLSTSFQLPVGFSDHSVGSLAAALSVVMGAKVIEKHFTLDRNMKGPDHLASSTPEEFSDLVRTVREAEASFGSPIKRCQDEEAQMSAVSRKSLVAFSDLPAGKIIEEGDIVLKRPGTGLAAKYYDDVVGRTASRNIEANSLLTWRDLD